MLNRIIAFIGLFLLFAASYAQEPITARQVPDQIKNDFQYRFVDAENVIWMKQSNDFYGAKFIFEKAKTEAIYSHEGLWVQTEQEIAYADMPERARHHCRQHFAGAKIKEVTQLSTRSYGIFFDIEVADGMKTKLLTFDQNGQLKEEKEIEEPLADQPEEKKKINLGGFWKKKAE